MRIVSEVLSIREARAGLSRIVAGFRDGETDVRVIGNHRRPQAVLMSAAVLQDLLQRMEDLEDLLAVGSRSGGAPEEFMTVEELGLAVGLSVAEVESLADEAEADPGFMALVADHLVESPGKPVVSSSQ